MRRLSKRKPLARCGQGLLHFGPTSLLAATPLTTTATWREATGGEAVRAGRPSRRGKVRPAPGNPYQRTLKSFFEREEESTDEGYSSRLHYDRAAAGDTVWLMNDMAWVVSYFGYDPCSKICCT